LREESFGYRDAGKQVAASATAGDEDFHRKLVIGGRSLNRQGREVRQERVFYSAIYTFLTWRSWR
jgi:hypothetical protein